MQICSDSNAFDTFNRDHLEAKEANSIEFICNWIHLLSISWQVSHLMAIYHGGNESLPPWIMQVTQWGVQWRNGFLGERQVIIELNKDLFSWVSYTFTMNWFRTFDTVLIDKVLSIAWFALAFGLSQGFGQFSSRSPSALVVHCRH